MANQATTSMDVTARPPTPRLRKALVAIALSILLAIGIASSALAVPVSSAGNGDGGGGVARVEETANSAVGESQAESLEATDILLLANLIALVAVGFVFAGRRRAAHV